MGAQPPPILRTTVLWIGMKKSKIGNVLDCARPPSLVVAAPPLGNRNCPGRVQVVSWTRPGHVLAFVVVVADIFGNLPTNLPVVVV